MGSREGASCNILDQQGGHMNNLVLIPLLVPMILAKYTVLYCTVLYYTVPMVLSKNSQVFDNCEDYFVSHKASWGLSLSYYRNIYLSKVLSGERMVTLRAESSNLTVLCRVDDMTGEVLLLVLHTIMDFIKVDGFQVKQLTSKHIQW